MEELLAAESGFSVLKTDRGVSVKKAAAPFLQALSMLPFSIGMFVLAVVATLVSGYLPVAIIREPARYDMSPGVAVALGVMFLAGAGVAWWVLGCLVIAISAVEKRVDRGQECVTCQSSIGRLVYWRRTLEHPVSVVAQVYDSRGDSSFRVFLKDTKGRRFSLAMPTVVGSRTRARQISLTLGTPISRSLKSEMVLETRTRHGWLPPEKLHPSDRAALDAPEAKRAPK